MDNMDHRTSVEESVVEGQIISAMELNKENSLTNLELAK